MSRTDVASTVGTWVAAFLAIVALFGVIGPWVLWRTLRSERHVAINAVDDPKHQFILSGIRIWRGTRVLRRIRAPKLMDPPALKPGLIYLRYDDQLLEPPSKTGWIMFAQGLRAFSVEFEKGGDLLIRNRETWLPAHKLWLLAFGLLGRFGRRPDKGQAVQRTSGSRLDHQIDDETSAELYGSLGVLTHLDFDKIFLAPYNLQLRGSLKPDNVPLSTLFWLSVACLPLDGSRVYDLCAVTPRYGSRLPLPSGSSASSRASSNDAANENDEQDRNVSHRHVSDRMAGPTGETQGDTSKGRVDQEPQEPQDEVQHGEGEKSMKSSPERMLRDLSVRLLRFEPLTDVVTSSRYSVWAQAMGCSMHHLRTLEQIEHESLDPVELDHVAATVRADQKLDDDSHWSSWIRLSRVKGRDRSDFLHYIWKTDVHCLALALLSIPCTPRHFLFDYKRGVFCHDILSEGTSGARYLKLAVYETFPHWNISIDREVFFEILLKAWEVDYYSPGFSRTQSEALYELDEYLQRVFPSTTAIRLTIGVLYLTSDTFRSFVEEVAEHDPAAKDSVVEVIMEENAIRTRSPRHNPVEYRFNFRDVFPHDRLPVLQPRTIVSLAEMMIAALQACTRSMWFDKDLDSTELLQLVESLDEIVHVSSKSQPPPRPVREIYVERRTSHVEDEYHRSPPRSVIRSESDGEIGHEGWHEVRRQYESPDFHSDDSRAKPSRSSPIDRDQPSIPSPLETKDVDIQGTHVHFKDEPSGYSANPRVPESREPVNIQRLQGPVYTIASEVDRKGSIREENAEAAEGDKGPGHSLVPPKHSLAAFLERGERIERLERLERRERRELLERRKRRKRLEHEQRHLNVESSAIEDKGKERLE